VVGGVREMPWVLCLTLDGRGLRTLLRARCRGFCIRSIPPLPPLLSSITLQASKNDDKDHDKEEEKGEHML